MKTAAIAVVLSVLFLGSSYCTAKPDAGAARVDAGTATTPQGGYQIVRDVDAGTETKVYE